ncbi:MAG: Clp protease N-terminal domain-containing protein [Planctomycetota bacterium]
MGLARQEAVRLNHDYIGTEHMLLGLVQERSGVAGDLLKHFGVDERRIVERVEELATCGGTPPTLGQLPFTPLGKRVLELSLEEAAGLGHNYIGTEHLLLGLIRVPDAISSRVLKELGLDDERVREQVVELVGASDPIEPRTPYHDWLDSIRETLDTMRSQIEQLEKRVRGLEERLGEAD